MQFDFTLSGGETGSYSFAIGPQPHGFEVRRERCAIHTASGQLHVFELASGRITNLTPPNPGMLPLPTSNRLYLVSFSGLTEFQPVYQLLSGMEFYTPDPEKNAP